MHKSCVKFLPGLLIIGLLSFGCAQKPDVAQDMTPKTSQAGQQVQKNVYKGVVVGKSNRAKTISIEVGKGKQAKTMMVKFDDQTKGVEHAVKGHAAIITFEKRDTDVYAKVVQQKLAKLPQGVTEIKTEELNALVTNAHQMYLVDSRPASRYGQSHLPGAVSIPVPVLKEKQAALLPADKNELLIFYCGGPT